MGRAGAGGHGGGGSHSSGGSSHHFSSSGGSGHRMTSHRPSSSPFSSRPSSSGPSFSASSHSSRPSSSPRPNLGTGGRNMTMRDAGMFTPPPPPPPRHDHHDHHRSPQVHVHVSPPPVVHTGMPRQTYNSYGNTYGNTYRNNTYSNNTYQPRMATTGPGQYERTQRKMQKQMTSIIVGTFIFFMILMVIGFFVSSSSGYDGLISSQKSTIQRTKLDDVPVYLNDCVIDEINWTNNPKFISSSIKNFYDKTGIQPYILLASYNPNLVTDSDKDAWAAKWFEDNLASKGYTNALLYVYFAEYDTDNEVGYMCLRYGNRASAIMDAEAIDIFWGYLDSFWDYYDESETDEMFIDTFNKTGDVIMQVSTTGFDVLKWLLIVVVVAVIGVTIIILIKAKFKREKEKAEETERILNTSMDDLVTTATEKDLLDKYSDKSNST